MRMPLTMYLLTTGVVAAALRCAEGAPIDRSAVVGTYVLNHAGPPDVIELRADGTYVHWFAGADGGRHTREDRWSLEPINGQQRITFDGFVFALPGYGTGTPSFWSTEIERDGDTIRLNVDHDRGVWYGRDRRAASQQRQ